MGRGDWERRAEDALYRAATALNERLSAYRSGQPDQMALHLRIRDLVDAGDVLPSPSELGWRWTSQFDEDGILVYLLSVVGFGGRRCVELGCGRPMGSNTTNLHVNWGFRGLGIDGDVSAIAAARRWFARNRATMFNPPSRACEVVSPHSVGDLLDRHGIDGEFDVLSIDLDGVDWWVWQALGARARIVVVEFNHLLPPSASITVADRDPISTAAQQRSAHIGASLEAMVRLGRRLGYRFVGTSTGPNAFFVRSDAANVERLPEVSVSAVLSQPSAYRPVPDESLLSLDWVEIGSDGRAATGDEVPRSR